MNKTKCDQCHEKASYFYKCACPKFIVCRNCSVGKYGYCPTCSQTYDRLYPKYPITNETKQLNSIKYNSSGKRASNKTYQSVQQEKKGLKVTQNSPLQSFKQSPILNKKPQKDGFSNEQRVRSFNSKKDYNQIPSYQTNMIGRSYHDDKPKQFDPFSQETNSQFQNPHETLQKLKKKLSTPYEKQKTQTKNLILQRDDNYQSLYKQNEKITTKPLTKEEQLMQILRNLQKKKGYFDGKCQKLYQLYDLAQVIDQVKWSQIVRLPNCSCIQKKQFVLTLLKDKCLICAAQKKYQNQRYELKNGFYICNNCQALVNSKDQNTQSYIKPLLYQCLTCEYSKIKKTKKQMHNPQNDNKDDLAICKHCFENSISRENRITQQKQLKFKMEQENRRSEEEYQRRLQESRRRRQEQNRKWQEDKRKRQQENKRNREKLQQQDLQRQLKIIQLMQQREKRQKEWKQHEDKQQQRKKQERQQRKQNQKLQKRNIYGKDDRVHQPMSNNRFQSMKQSRQKEIKRTYQSSDKSPKDYHSRKCVACDRNLTFRQKGTEIEGTFLCLICSIKNKSQLKFLENSKIPQINKFVEKFENKGKMRTEDEGLYSKGRQQILNRFPKNVYQYKPSVQQFNYLNLYTISKQGNDLTISNVRKFKKSSVDSEPKQNDNMKLVIKGKQEQKQESPVQQQQFKSSQNGSKQPTYKSEKNKDSAMTCGECQFHIDSIEKLGIKNEDGLILCSKCFELQKSRIQNGGESSSNFQSERLTSEKIESFGFAQVNQIKFEKELKNQRKQEDQKRRQDEKNRRKKKYTLEKQQDNRQQQELKNQIREEENRRKQIQMKRREKQLQQEMIVRSPPNFDHNKYQYETEHQQQPNARSIILESSKTGRNLFHKQNNLIRIQQDSIQNYVNPSSNNRSYLRMKNSQMPMLPDEKEQQPQFQHFSAHNSFLKQKQSNSDIKYKSSKSIPFKMEQQDSSQILRKSPLPQGGSFDSNNREYSGIHKNWQKYEVKNQEQKEVKKSALKKEEQAKKNNDYKVQYQVEFLESNHKSLQNIQPKISFKQVENEQQDSEYSNILSPSVIGDSVCFQMQDVAPFQNHNKKQQEQRSIMADSRKQKSRKSQEQISQELSIRQQQMQEQMLNRSMKRQSMIPEKDNSHSSGSQKLGESELKRQHSEIKSNTPFDPKISEIPLPKSNNFIDDQQSQNSLEMTEMEIHNMIIENKVKENQHKKIDYMEDYQPAMNEKLEISLSKGESQQIQSQRLVPCTHCEYRIGQSNAFCVSEDPNNKLYLCLSCSKKHYYEVKQAEQESQRRSRINDSRMSRGQKLKSKVSQAVKGSDSLVRNDVSSSSCEVKTPDRHSQVSNSSPFIQSQKKESPQQSKVKFDEVFDNNEVNDFDQMAFLEERRRKTAKTSQRNVTDEYRQEEEEEKTEVKEQKQQKKEQKQQKKQCEICRKQNTVLCFGRICLDCFKKQKLLPSKQEF